MDEVAARLPAVEAGLDTHQSRPRLHLADGLWLTLSVARVGGVLPSDRRHGIAVTLEETSRRNGSPSSPGASP
ncbi:hypothetical protein ACIQJT_39315 [Streptomyces sp. NPDC091972]|uniref:hypothetical protein n=1 Tax=Streptomyces sp. NPDC091972 TaxID=3366007 RepID=UPI003805C054